MYRQRLSAQRLCTEGKFQIDFGHQRGSVRNGSILAFIGADPPFAEIFLWNTSRQAVQTIIRVNNQFSLPITFRPDGKALAVIVSSESPPFNTLTFWDVRTGVQLGIHPEEEIRSIAYSPDGQILAKGRGDRTIQLQKVANPFDGTENGEVLHTLKASSRFVFSPDSKLLASRGNDEVEVWGVQTGTLHRTFVQENLTSFTFSPDSQTLVMGGGLKGVEFWDIEGEKRQAIIPNAGGGALTFNRDGRVLTLASAPPTSNPRKQIVLTRWDTHTGTALNNNEVMLRVPWASLAKLFSPDGQLIAVGQHGSVSVWNAATGDRLQIWERPEVSFGSVVFSPDNRFLAAAQYSASQASSITVWEIASGIEYRQFQSPPDAALGSALAFSPDGNTLAIEAGSTSPADGAVGTIQLRNIHTEEIIRVLPGHETSVASLAFSPDGRTLASGGGFRIPPFTRDFTVRVWDVSTGEQRHVLAGHEGKIGTLEFSPDGRLLASGDGEREVKLWLVSEGKELRSLPRHSSGVRDLAFSPDGRRLAVLASSVLIWNLTELFDTFPPAGVEMQAVPLVSQTTLLPNFPNPFNPETWMPYMLHRDADVQIDIYDVQGHPVRFLNFGRRVAGPYDRHCNAAYWDGRNDAGERLTSGIYFYTLRAGGFRTTRKMVLRK